jgi:hypothetical protein
VAKLLLTVTRDPDRASLDAVKSDLGLDDDEIDHDFGVVSIDPNRNRYAILVEDRTADRLGGEPGVEGPFANPPIEPFGPPES